MGFFEKYIGHMYGPYFLIFYLLVIASLYFLCRYCYLITDKSSAAEALKIPSEPDPYAIAYIRNGPKEQLKVILFSLLERGYLISSSGKESIKQKKNPPPVENLTKIEKTVFDWVKTSTKIEAVIEDKENLDKMESLSNDLDFCKRNIDMTISNEKIKFFKVAKGISIVLISVLGIYKYNIAVANGHNNVMFLILLGFAGIIIIVNLKYPTRTSKKGQQFIKDLETIYDAKYQQGIKGASPYYQLLLASIFGFHLLHEKGYSFLENYNRSRGVASSGGWGGCGSSCGGSCGGGCGGGCGGCS